MTTTKEYFNQNKALLISKIIPLEFCQFFTHVMLRKSDIDRSFKDPQVPNALAIMDHDLMFETLQEYLWPTLEDIVGEELLPTYAYARLYGNGDVLEKHIDRPSCEVSITIQLGKSHDYIWPIFMGNTKYNMLEGDGVIYKGCEVQHWRDKCDGPNGYYSGQVFLHFVRKNGPFTEHANDLAKRDGGTTSYVKNRIWTMQNK